MFVEPIVGGDGGVALDETSDSATTYLVLVVILVLHALVALLRLLGNLSISQNSISINGVCREHLRFLPSHFGLFCFEPISEQFQSFSWRQLDCRLSSSSKAWKARPYAF